MIIVDACHLGTPPGQIHKIEIASACYPDDSAGIHQIGPLETLSIATVLYPEQIPKRVLAVLVETNGLVSDAMRQACERVVDIIDDEIYFSETASP